MKRFVLAMAVPLAVLLVIASPAQGQFGKNKIRYDSFEWRIYETPHFQISYYDRTEPLLEKVASFAESSYDELARRLNHQVSEPITMIAYATHAEFEQTNVSVNFIPEGAGAFATPVRNRMVLPLDLSDQRVHELIQHELTHIFQYDILFQGRRGRAIYSRPPLWFMEGMASYFADDEEARARAYMRDAALSNLVPSVGQPVGGYFAYRFGHLVFEYIEAEWGEDGLRDFIFSFRGGLGGRINRPFRRTFNMDAEEFDSRFRAWLRKKYQPFTGLGLPEEFGRRFRVDQFGSSQEVAPVATPSGDLIAAFSTYKQDLDVVLLGVPDRRLYKNLTKGFDNSYQYLVAQGLTVGPDRGGDLAISPDGNLVAVFGRTERTRSLFLIDALKGGIERVIEIPLPIERALEPAFSPDGATVAFNAFRNGQPDIFLLDLASEQITNLTNDDAYDSAPVFTPDGDAIVYSSETAERAKLVKISLSNPSNREQLTRGPGNDEGAAFSPDGERLYFASDRDTGVLNIYQLDLESGQLMRITNVFGIAINPAPVQTLEGERVVFQAYARGRWDLFIADPNEGEVVGEQPPQQLAIDLEPYVPDMTVSIDPDRVVKKKKRKYFLEDAATYVGVDQNQNFISNTYLSLSDNYGDRRIFGSLQSVADYTNIQLGFINLEPRLQWGVTVFDQRYYYLWGYDPYDEDFNEREQIYRQTGAALTGQYPLSLTYRLEGQVGVINRKVDLPTGVSFTGAPTDYFRSSDKFLFTSFGVVGDTTRWRSWGPHAGLRWAARATYGQILGGEGGDIQEISLDARKYIPISSRNELALRLFAGYSDGDIYSVFIFGGLDTLRGTYVNGLAGNRAGYLNAEWRFPIIDRLDTPILRLADVRGHLFFDIGAAWYELDGRKLTVWGDGFTFAEDGRLVDGVSAYGFGISLTLFGIPVHWEFLKRWDLKETLGETEVDFWVGYKF